MHSRCNFATHSIQSFIVAFLTGYGPLIGWWIVCYGSNSACSEQVDDKGGSFAAQLDGKARQTGFINHGVEKFDL
jgi:hypothetical protein